jgi:hypothetical protein
MNNTLTFASYTVPSERCERWMAYPALVNPHRFKNQLMDCTLWQKNSKHEINIKPLHTQIISLIVFLSHKLFYKSIRRDEKGERSYFYNIEAYLLNSCDLCLANCWGVTDHTHKRERYASLVMMAKETIPLNNEVNLHLAFKKHKHI